jgi:glycerophosphoryl diester phosphodiesterase
LLLLLAGCAPEAGTPLIVAFAGGRGYWPADSRTAVEGVIDGDFDAIELGVSLTADRVPVVWHEPLLYGCTDALGLLPEVAWTVVHDLTAEELRDGVLCGGLPDPTFDQALVVAEPVLTFDELVTILREQARDDLEVQLYVGYEQGYTARPEVVAGQVLDRWIEADLPQALLVSSEVVEVVQAFEAEGRVRAFEVPTSLFLYPDERLLEAQRLTGQLDYVQVARDAGADGVSVGWALADPLLLRSARREGLPVRLHLADDPRVLERWARSDLVDAVLTDFPGDVP